MIPPSKLVECLMIPLKSAPPVFRSSAVENFITPVEFSGYGVIGLSILRKTPPQFESNNRALFQVSTEIVQCSGSNDQEVDTAFFQYFVPI